MLDKEAQAWQTAAEALRGERRYQPSLQEDIAVEAANVEQFLIGPDGQIALDLIDATGKPLVFTFNPNEKQDNYGLCYGLVRNKEGNGQFVEISGTIEQRVYTPITTEEAIAAANTYGNVVPSNFLLQLRMQLNAITDTSLRQHQPSQPQ